MTVNKIGRPSKAPERIAEILSATAVVAARDGLANTTMSNVAEAAGMQRTLVLHYFRTRDELIERFLTDAVAHYGAAMLQPVGSGKSLRQRIIAMFGPDAYGSRDDLVIWAELIAMAGRDPKVRERLRVMWTEQWLVEMERQLSSEYPASSPTTVSAAAYGLACLFEAHWAFHLQDVTGPRRRRQAVEAAHAILGSLENRPRTDPASRSGA
ncbi:MULTISPECIES: TetR/AcrR family transcriptional regulator [unclassified Mycobacterium]|uniref:TetR/AcrR family transcriptional regulator n=1 Tax=unclassified Mycobacterium TaxID=2642494 RepID=UPI0029C75A07|nr:MULTISPECIES: TetR/AcrR family transcriptional regulator [unclassified Mycobacterium]